MYLLEGDMLVSWNVVPWKLTAGTLENSPLKRNIIWTKPSFFWENSSCEFSKGKKPSPFLQSMHLLGWRLDFYRFFGSNNFQAKLETGNLSFWRDIFLPQLLPRKNNHEVQISHVLGTRTPRLILGWIHCIILKNRHMTYCIVIWSQCPNKLFFSTIFNFLGLTSFGRTLSRESRIIPQHLAELLGNNEPFSKRNGRRKGSIPSCELNM